MKHYLSSAAVTLGCVLTLSLCMGCGPGGSQADPWAHAQPGQKRVVVSFAPLECFVKNVGGDDIALVTLATTTGPHHFEPSVGEALKLQAADLFFVNGLELDDRFTDRMAQASRNPRLTGPNKPGYINIGDRLLALDKGLIDKMAHDEGGHDHDHHHGHHHGEFDPHFWLGIPQAIATVEIIRDELKKVDPENASGYDQRADRFIAELKQLHEEGQKKLEGKKNRKIITNHDSLHYFGRSFDVDIAGVVQIHPGAEPEARSIADLVKLCNDKGVRVIATEPQYRQKGAAQSLLRELKVKGIEDAVIIEIDPLETVTDGDEVDAGWYLRKMKENLDILAGALQ